MAKLNPTRNSLPEKRREAVIGILLTQLANLIDLHLQTRDAHWNVRGAHFISLHKLFEELGDSVEDEIDPLAERITALGGRAVSGLKEVAGLTELEAFPAKQKGDLHFAKAMADRFAAAGSSARSAIDRAESLGDADSADLLTGISRMLDKSLWLLEAHLG